MTKDRQSEGAERVATVNEDVPDELRPANLGLSSPGEKPGEGEEQPSGAPAPPAEDPRPDPGPDLDPDSTD